jgi:NAD(P)-dependent dehydrogenase (short-subunit alcohol dehydrogenase family)
LVTSLALDGKVSLITGAGSGVGRAMARLFAEQGSIVAIVDVVASRVNEVVTEINQSGKRSIGIAKDLSVKSEVEAMVDEVVKSKGKVDVLCNNAGIMDAVKPVAETDDALWDRVLNTNLGAAFRASRRVIPVMLEHGGGVILNTASVAGLYGGRAGAAYTVSKHGLIGLTRSVAASYGSRGIRCNAMVLGAVQTSIGLGGEPSPLGFEILKKTMATLPRMADPLEIAKLALFLASDDSSFVNGSCVTIDGGWTVY